ncbi:MAG: trypsin-like peptidase domain-containing protein [Proteobacteria bacterium]|nr:trypsin-like peptidase domain-containing protein [Pseudomonadota bacterium]MBU1450591.1 trypsin-like peptidase domain-containing protein [Pseudomonadota bacterium]MBU2469170.1 trypsin-like peptidase domain-containing protein [Pseudomonadota bacterium]MBU2516898.1 trypsin-like peptidase domain-containing protein [Pseudomonadota bacterium]
MKKNLFMILGLGLCLCMLAVSPALADRMGRVTPVVAVVRAVGPAVVNISSTARVRVSPFRSGDDMMDRFFREFFQPLEREQTNLGSGVIIDGKRGLIVTNSHVVDGGGDIRVQLSDRRVFKAKLLGADPSSDLAVLQITPRGSPLPQVKLGDSRSLMIGESLIAIGNPFGLQHTVTTGVVSALNRRVPTGPGEYMGGLIQTDASINPGNSGGPLLNLDGEVMGINTAIFQRAQGIGFAIPVNRVRRVMDDLLAHGKVSPTWLGLELQDLTPSLASHFGLEAPSGVVVLGVVEQSPAAKAGLKRGEVVLALDEVSLEDTADYQSRLGSVAPGQAVKLWLLEKGRRRGVTLVAERYPMERAKSFVWQRLGLELEPMDELAAQRNRVPPGKALMVSRIRSGSTAERAGLQPGDLVRRMGREPVSDLDAFYLDLVRSRHQPKVAILFQRGRAQQVITFGR